MILYSLILNKTGSLGSMEKCKLTTPRAQFHSVITVYQEHQQYAGLADHVKEVLVICQRSKWKLRSCSVLVITPSKITEED